ncbi:LPXTG cell wall anchor domain-containing protein [Nocardioides sp. CFH 31398]|uniref:DUF7507 domain-containing protein n=1 Tax=Nocardioides sp. CFH 31398 TaxID=2919579 RepID=UPI001F051F2E|nr:LPXTG cell wall anchor domain-containing protein [Nocardioides sp. CFH 31398]MCH1867232.1 DUF11 domain-containing protein [Nocardioides sp. CFH 31398]
MARSRPLARLRLALAVSLAALGSLTGLSLAAGPAAAEVVDPLERVHTEQVTGDVLTVGNAVLVCPDDPQDAREQCLAASRRENQLNNNRFAMRYADVDSDDETYNSSTAEVALPAGARVTYARLSWAGNREPRQCGVGDPGDYPEGSARTNPVRLTVAGGPTREVAPGEYTQDPGSIGYYSADAVVTGAFADLPVADAARDVVVTVGNVFAAEGRGCFGGWSLTLVHTADAAGCDARRREVFVYDGHVRQGVGDDPQRVRVSGFRATGGAVRAGVTAYEGDNGQVGDRLRVNGTPLEDPATGRADTFFASTAQGRVAPGYPNTFSVDAKRVEVPDGVIDAGDTGATLEVSTGAASGSDAFLLQGLTLSVPMPSLCLRKTVSPTTARVGDTVEWTLVVRNPSSIDATDVEITDPGAPDCEEPAFDLDAGESRTVRCTSVVTEDLVNVASVAGRGGGTTLSAVDSTAVRVVDPSVAITKTVAPASVVDGEQVEWTLQARNTGDTPLTEVRVADPLVPGCARQVGGLAVGASDSWTCRSTVTDDGSGSLTNTATVRAAAPGGPDVRDADAATVAVEPAPTAPAVEIVKTAVTGRVDPGGTARWDITVTNTGAGPLTDVTVADPLATRCDRTVGTLPAGESRSYRCGLVVRDDVLNEATVTATGDDDTEVTDTDTAAVTVRDRPPYTVTVTPERARTVPGEDVDLTVELTNDGTQPVTGLVVTGGGAAEDCTRRRPIILAPGDSRSYACTAAVGDGGGDVRARVSALGEVGGFPTPARAGTPVEVLVPEVGVALGVVPPADGTDGRTSVEVSNTGETPLRALRLGIEGATLCQLPDGPLAVDGSVTLTCGAARGDVTARVSAQPALDGAAVGPRVRATATDTTDNGGIAPIGGDDGTGTDPYDPGSPYAPDDPGSTSPGGLLPDTGASGAMLPVALGGAGLVALGLWLLRRSRHPRNPRPRPTP